MDAEKARQIIDKYNDKVREAVDILEKKHGTRKAVAFLVHMDPSDFCNSYNNKRDWRLHEVALILHECGFTLIRNKVLEALHVFATKGLENEQEEEL